MYAFNTIRSITVEVTFSVGIEASSLDSWVFELASLEFSSKK